MAKKKKKPEYLYTKKSCYDMRDTKILKDMDKFVKSYKTFLTSTKTERQAVREGEKLLTKAGFQDLNKFKGKDIAGKKFFYSYREKNLFGIIGGKKPLKEGIRLICAHIDNPRIDIKHSPVYDEDHLALFKTHYYGGIKKYQWLTVPLSLMGVIYDQKGKKLEISIGENDDEPALFISDILPHLGRKQMEKKAKEFVEAEEMNAIIGSAYSPEKEEKLSENIFKLLHKKYGIIQKSFLGAELCMVPAYKPRDVGLDASMVGAYGQDDRACAYIALRSLLDMAGTPEHTCIVYLVDKEEIGSEGASSSKSRIFNYVLGKLNKLTTGSADMLDMDEILLVSKGISGDVSVIIDPNFKAVFDPKNNASINHGVVIEKYTGYGGKFTANDADAEYMHAINELLDKHKIPYQYGGLGRVDEGGGGTISKDFAKQGMDIVDMGPGVLNMHSPFEVIAKADLYATYQAYSAFWKIK